MRQMTLSSTISFVCMALLAMTPLVSADLKEDYFAACAAGETDVVAKALKEDPDLVNSMSEEGESCMMLAAIENSYDMVKLLVESGGDVNEKAVGENNHRMPVLGWHILAGNHEIIDFLIVHGADVNQEFDGVDEEGSMFGIFTSLDLVDFLLHQINQEEHPEITEKYKVSRQMLIDNGGRIFIGGIEL